MFAIVVVVVVANGEMKYDDKTGGEAKKKKKAKTGPVPLRRSNSAADDAPLPLFEPPPPLRNTPILNTPILSLSFRYYTHRQRVDVYAS